MNRVPVAFLLLLSCCHVTAIYSLSLPRDAVFFGLQCIIRAFTCHTHLLFVDSHLRPFYSIFSLNPIKHYRSNNKNSVDAEIAPALGK